MRLAAGPARLEGEAANRSCAPENALFHDPHDARVVREARPCHISRMTTEQKSPYSLEVFPCERPAGHFEWAIRERGKLLQRSDRKHPSEDKARENGQAQIDHLIHGGVGRR